MTCWAKNREVFGFAPPRPRPQWIEVMGVKRARSFVSEIATLADNLSAVARTILLFDYL